jgi:hypothetical protein
MDAVSLSMQTCQNLMDIARQTGGRAYCNTNGFKDAIAEIVDTGSHFYTLSYVPTNPNWNGAYRKIKIDVPSVTTQSVNDKVFEWLLSAHYGDPRVAYRNGYYARDAPHPSMNPSLTPAAAQRRVISISPKGDPANLNFTLRTPLNAAESFGTPPPADLHFTVAVNPSTTTEQLPPGAPLPAGNYLATEWQDKPFRNYKLHYTINPADLHFSMIHNIAKNSYQYNDSFQFLVVVYRDDGGVVNSIATTANSPLDEASYYHTMQKGLTFDQTIAVPTDDYYSLRVVVEESNTSHIGAIEIPYNSIQYPAPTGGDSHREDELP